MIYDAHSHLMPGRPGEENLTPEQFCKRISSIGVGGGSIFSLPPASDRFYETSAESAPSNKQRIANVLEFCAGLPKSFYPFYWINPTEPDAVDQVIYAKEQGICGFKVLCNSYYPEEGKAVYAKAAELNLPVLFHSGVLWDGKVSSQYNRPMNFEFLQNIPNLRFALAHMSWPWCDECIALFGKVRNTEAQWRNGVKMYIDCSPGAPEFDRVPAFRKMGLFGYGFEDRLMWGIDAYANRFDEKWGKSILDFDRRTFEKLHQQYSDPAVVKEELGYTRGSRETIDFREFFRRMTEENYLRFLGK